MVEIFEKKPIFVFVIWVITLLMLGFYSAQVAVVGIGLIVLHFPMYSIAILGMVFFVAGLPLFWRVYGPGWVLFFLGNSSFVLFACSNMLHSLQVKLPIVLSDVIAVVVHLAMLVVLSSRRVFQVFGKREVRLWSRAERIPTRLHGSIAFGSRRLRGTLSDVSSSGCSFHTTDRIPISEVVEFNTDEGIYLSLQILREINVEKDDDGSSRFRYGARFRVRPPANVLARLQEEGLQSLLQPDRSLATRGHS